MDMDHVRLKSSLLKVLCSRGGLVCVVECVVEGPQFGAVGAVPGVVAVHPRKVPSEG